MEKRRLGLIWIIGILLFAIAINNMIYANSIKFHLLAVQFSIVNFVKDLKSLGLFTTISNLIVLILPFFYIIGSIAFLLLIKWSRSLIMGCLILDIPLRLYGIINFWYIWFTTRVGVVLPKGCYTIAISMIPIYIIFICELIIIYLLTRPKIKEQFK